MYKKIIVGLSLEHGIADRALRTARALGGDGAEILAVHVAEPLQGSVRFHIREEDMQKARAQMEADLQERLADHPDVTPVVIDGHAGQSLSEYAGTVGADCIVVASHKPGLRDFLLGSTAARIVRHAPCSVHVLR
ncbi:MAG: universal stress protein [Zhengella sp.]|uniref:universal stress protein n=1 Tax=Zhengella sp. TaxID=2282762 RepID=UPI001DAB980C|nr:universal stress protein [Notoacmeibacter sp.]